MIDPAAREALRAALGERLRFDEPMARQVSLRVGGPADALATPADRDELAALLRVCREQGLPQRVIGSGFNTLVLDEGVDGVVIHLKAFRRLEHADGVVHAEAGVSHGRLTNHCVQHGLSGLEFGAGIPGTIGGWVAMNAGIGEREVKDVAESVEVMVPGDARARELSAEALRFRYRSVPGLPADAVIVSARLRVTPAQPEAVRAEVKRMLAKRADSQPIQQPSCGSVFKNPPGDFAGRLIEAAGLKGERVGGAGISTLHANFIVNLGGATAGDVLALIELARHRVKHEAGVELEPEVRIVGRDA